MSIETIEQVKQMIIKSLENASDMIDDNAWGFARIYLDVATELLDLANTIRDKGDPNDPDEPNSNVVRLIANSTPILGFTTSLPEEIA